MTRATAAALVALVALSACGVRTQSHPRLTARDDVPFGLADDRPASTTTVPAPDPFTGEVWLLTHDGHVAAVTRSIDEASPQAVLAALLDGPTPQEAAFGLRTALPEGLPVHVEVTGGVAAVDLGAAFADLPADAQRDAIAQLVFTLTGRPGIGRVSFTLDGKSIEIPRGDGTLATGSVSRDSYQLLAPE